MNVECYKCSRRPMKKIKITCHYGVGPKMAEMTGLPLSGFDFKYTGYVCDGCNESILTPEQMTAKFRSLKKTMNGLLKPYAITDIDKSMSARNREFMISDFLEKMGMNREGTDFTAVRFHIGLAMVAYRKQFKDFKGTDNDIVKIIRAGLEKEEGKK